MCEECRLTAVVFLLSISRPSPQKVMRQVRGHTEEAEVMSAFGGDVEGALTIARELSERGLLVSVLPCTVVHLTERGVCVV